MVRTMGKGIEFEGFKEELSCGMIRDLLVKKILDNRYMYSSDEGVRDVWDCISATITLKEELKTELGIGTEYCLFTYTSVDEFGVRIEMDIVNVKNHANDVKYKVLI